MTQKIPDIPSDFRLQGTDGIRGETMPASAIERLTPQQAFLDRQVITEEFMELYAFAHVNRGMVKKELKPGDTIVVGWDPRDPRGVFTNAVVKGVRKAKATALVLGAVPTPLVPMYMLYKKAHGGFMVTASHNPRDQNGIKTFFPFRGLKFLPQNDAQLTRAILACDYSSLAQKKPTGRQVSCRTDALQFFMRFSLDPENSWQGSVSFKNIILVVDPANGSLAGIAAEIFRQAGFGQVVEVNNKLNGDVNLYSGVADLEGHATISLEMIRKGAFRKHQALLKLFELGKKHQKTVRQGTHRLCGAVFDADGDRFYLLEYNPFENCLLVRSGDETAFLQARYLMARHPEQYKNSIYLNTVESDLNAVLAVKKLGFKPQVTPVGDKWILSRIASTIIENRLKTFVQYLKNCPKNRTRIKNQNAVSRLEREFKQTQNCGIFDIMQLEKIEAALDKIAPQKGALTARESIAPVVFSIGSEETGHNITLGRLERETGERVTVFAGNGLKSALNTFVADESVAPRSKTPTAHWFRPPFKPGFKQTCYAYYVKKELFYKNSRIWRQVKQRVFAWAGEQGFHCRISAFPEDPDMLYIILSATPPGSRNKTNRVEPQATIFIRNSGTENKIGVNLRGTKKRDGKLKSLGEDIVRLLFSTLKDHGNPLYKLERDLLRRYKEKTSSKSRIAPDQALAVRLLAEMQKQLLIQADGDNCRLTARGKWYLGTMSHE